MFTPHNISILILMILFQILLSIKSTDKEDKVFLSQRLIAQRFHAKTTVLLHVHIPKVGGTAIAIALSSNCSCQSQKEGKLMKKVCTNCPIVHGKGGFTKKYSYSRLTGWTFGLHAPFGVMYARTQRHAYVENGVYPIFIILLREPFARFISESTHLVKKNECFRDWSSVVGCMLSSRLSYRAKKPIDAFVADYAKLNSSYLIQNRQTKMIGGESEQYNMGFIFRKNIGSRWLPNDIETDSLLNTTTLIKSKEILARNPFVLFGIHERFLEMICILEILYGHIYTFNYNPNLHAHQTNKTYNMDEEKRINEQWRNTNVYQDWMIRNQPDIELYNTAVRLFDLEFQAALELLHEVAEKEVLNVPHCVSFITPPIGTKKQKKQANKNKNRVRKKSED